jgi:holo-[acyl-carrier protein] synthase
VIYGIGTDICAVARMERLLTRYGGRPAQRILTPAEQAEFARAYSPARFLAKRFAAKEAFGKALGTGMRDPVVFGAVGVGHDAHGKPILEFAPAVAALMDERGLRAHISLSDEEEMAVSFVVIEQGI